jgi:hypothetical protein
MPEKRVLRHARAAVATVVGLIAAPLLVTGVGVSPAHADDLPYIAWTTYLPGWTDEYLPSSDNDCVAGRPSCLRATLKKFGTILKANASSCTHASVFAMTYTRITQTYGYVRDIPGYFEDVPYINHMDAVFAKYYFDAYDAYQAGNRAAVPAAWQTAFDAARDRRMTGTGDLLLGINAHVNRDLAYVYARFKVRSHADHLVVNPVLARVQATVLPELVARYDADLLSQRSRDPALSLDIVAWRELAWRNAKRLRAARSRAARREVAAGIERHAAAMARRIRAAFPATADETAARDAHCASATAG